MKLAKIGAYLRQPRQPSSLIAAAIVIGTGIADWFGVLPEGASIALFGAAIPLLAISDTSGILAKVSNDRDGLAAIVHALTTHKDFGPAAIKVASDAVPGGAFLAAAASALAQQQATPAAPTAKSSGIGSGGVTAMLLLVGLSSSLVACGDGNLVQRKQSVYGLSLSYSAAAQLAADYEKNPAADPSVVIRLKSAFQTAHDQIKPLDEAARHGDPLTQAEITAAQDALAAARKLLPASTK